MAAIPSMPDQRKHQRFSLKNGVYVVNRNGLGRIIDISLGGLAFYCANKGKLLCSTFELNLFLSEENQYINGVTCRTVRDLQFFNMQPFAFLMNLHRAVEFEDPTPALMSQLDYIIHAHATGEA